MVPGRVVIIAEGVVWCPGAGGWLVTFSSIHRKETEREGGRGQEVG